MDGLASDCAFKLALQRALTKARLVHRHYMISCTQVHVFTCVKEKKNSYAVISGVQYV
jgi:hypothetical protein